MNNVNASVKGSRLTIRRAVQVALASSMLASTMAGAVLRDRGPENASNHFPNWYRSNDGLIAAQCIAPDDAGNGPLCLTSTADAIPGRFAGNIGDEAFYATADIVIPVTGGDFHWMNHLEMAYLTADGLPPAVWNANDRQEVVFSRERMTFDVPVTGIAQGEEGSCAGHYTIRTPLRVHEFDLEEGKRSLFFTDDLTPIPGDFNAALKGHMGPFFTWDVGQDGVNPVSAANPAVFIDNPVAGQPDRKYMGDPNIEHVFVGSTLPAAEPHLDKGFNNYVEITPPTTCDLGAGAGVPVFNELASISGAIWDQPIADPVTITKAAYTRSGGAASLDVWATAAKDQNITLSASTDASQHLPSVTMKQEGGTPNGTGFYHTHLDFDAAETIPPQVTAVNLTSVPASRSTASVVDAVVVTKSVYDPVTKALCIAAHSGDETSPVPLRLEAPGFGAFTAPTGTCPGVAGNDVVLERTLAATEIPPQGILVRSDKGGSETSQPVIGNGASDATVLTQTVEDTFDLDGTGTTTLDVLANDTPAGPSRVVVVSQPEVGTVTAAASGNPVFQAEEGMATGPQTFFYALQNTTDNTVSNVSKVTLNVTQVIPPPVTLADAQGVFRTSTGATINVLANDLTGLTSTPIDPASVELVDPDGAATAWSLSNANKTLTGPRGVITAQNDGTLLYVPQNQGSTVNNAVFSVQYTVANVSGNGRRSAPTTVKIVLKSSAEAIAFQRVRPTWDIRFTSTFAGTVTGATTGTNAGEAGTVVLAPVATCKLYTNSTAYANGTGTPIGTVGSAAPAAGANNYVVTGSSPAAPGGNNWVMGCTTTSGGRGSRTGQL